MLGRDSAVENSSINFNTTYRYVRKIRHIINQEEGISRRSSRVHTYTKELLLLAILQRFDLQYSVQSKLFIQSIIILQSAPTT